MWTADYRAVDSNRAHASVSDVDGILRDQRGMAYTQLLG